MAELSPMDDLRRRLRRTELLLLRAVRRMRGRPPNTARGEHWGNLITDDELDELLLEVGELSERGVPGESEARLEEAIRNARVLRDAPGPLWDELRADHGLDGLDVDILLLALGPDVFEGYGRILAFLNDYAVMPWATVDVVARVIETRRTSRLAVLERLLPDAPLVRDGLVTLQPLDPVIQPFAWHRLQVSRPLAIRLLGLDAPVDVPVARPALAVVDAAGDAESALDAERTEDMLSSERRGLFRDLVRKWRNFVSGSGERSPEGPREAEPARTEAARLEPARADVEPARHEPPRPRPLAPSSSPQRLGLADVRSDLARRLQRADLLLLHAVRLHREQAWVAESARGKDLMNLSLITEREVQDLLLHRGDPYLSGPTGLEPSLEGSLLQRDAPGGRLGELRARCGLTGVDADILLLALLPELSTGYRRIFQFLNSFLHDHLTVGLLTRVLGATPAERLEIRRRLTPQAPLLQWDLVAAHPVFPTQDHLSALRVALSPAPLHFLLGHGPPPGSALADVLQFRSSTNVE